MKPGHSIPKIRGLCNWSGSTVCPCVRVSLCVVEMVWLCNRVDIAANKIQWNFEPCCTVEGQFVEHTRMHACTHTRTGSKVSDHLWIIDTEAMCQSPWSGLETEQIRCAPNLTSTRPCYTHTHRHTLTCTGFAVMTTLPLTNEISGRYEELRAQRRRFITDNCDYVSLLNPLPTELFVQVVLRDWKW